MLQVLLYFVLFTIRCTTSLGCTCTRAWYLYEVHQCMLSEWCYVHPAHQVNVLEVLLYFVLFTIRCTPSLKDAHAHPGDQVNVLQVSLCSVLFTKRCTPSLGYSCRAVLRTSSRPGQRAPTADASCDKATPCNVTVLVVMLGGDLPAGSVLSCQGMHRVDV